MKDNLDNEQLALSICAQALKQGDYKSLLAHAENFFKAHENIIFKRYLALACYHTGDFKRAKEIFYSLYLTKLTREKREDDELLGYLGLCAILTNDYGRAIELFKKLKTQKPRNVEYRLLLYLAYYCHRDAGKSLKELAEALRVNPEETRHALKSLLHNALEKSQLSDATKMMIENLALDLSV